MATKDAFFVHRTIKYIQEYLHDVDKIYVISNKKNNVILNRIPKRFNNVVILDENNIIDGLSFSAVKESLRRFGADRITGWYFQQFIKLGFALTSYASQFYMSWDADTLPLSEIPFEKDGKIYFDYKKEYHKPYFETINNLLGLKKEFEHSFIAEHMMFEKEYVLQMISDINRNGASGFTWWEKIIDACDFSESLNSFSEFETYGTYVYSKNRDHMIFRQLSTFRKGGMICGRLISDNKIKDLSFDLDTVSFELRDMPCFPLNIGQYLYRIAIKMISKLL